jgi:hypothetical protein
MTHDEAIEILREVKDVMVDTQVVGDATRVKDIRHRTTPGV